jgi:predicted O-methyltransferase YrrM
MAGFRRITNNIIRAVLRPVVRSVHEFVWREPAAALREELARRALVAAADFVTENMPSAAFCADKYDHLSFAFVKAPDGLALEFGVHKGTTINHLASKWRDRHFFGFDSFHGLPEQWTGPRTGKVNFDRGGRAPKVAANVTLVAGWFHETLPAFLTREAGPIGFMHVDCDIYSSTKTVLELTAPRLTPGAVIVFDEFFNYRGYEDHEYKAFFEFVERFGVKYRFFGYSGQQVSVVVDAISSDAA